MATPKPVKILSRQQTLQKTKSKNEKQPVEIAATAYDTKTEDKEKPEKIMESKELTEPKEKINAMTPLERSSLFWKIARPKFAVVNYLCPICRKMNYKHPQQFRVEDGMFYFTQVMCQQCLHYNMMQTDIYNKHTKNPH